MTVESTTNIQGLNASSPANTGEPRREGAAQIRLIKNVLKTSFPNFTGPMTASNAVLSKFAGVEIELPNGVLKVDYESGDPLSLDAESLLTYAELLNNFLPLIGGDVTGAINLVNSSGPEGVLEAKETHVEIGSSSAHPLRLVQNNNTRITINNGAGVQIGGTSPVSIPSDAAYLAKTPWIDRAGSSIAQFIEPKGFKLTRVTSSTFSVSAGVAQADGAVDSTRLVGLNSTLTKTLGAWAAGSGNGSLDTGSAASSTWYHVYCIRNPTTGSEDVLISTGLPPTSLPSGYTLWRRLGSIYLDGSTLIRSFIHIPPHTFQWAIPVRGYGPTLISTGGNNFTLAGDLPPNVGLGLVATISINADNARAVRLQTSVTSITGFSLDLSHLKSPSGVTQNSVRIGPIWKPSAAASWQMAASSDGTVNTGELYVEEYVDLHRQDWEVK